MMLYLILVFFDMQEIIKNYVPNDWYIVLFGGLYNNNTKINDYIIISSLEAKSLNQLLICFLIGITKNKLVQNENITTFKLNKSV
jgi:hypothetical protein